METKLFAIDDSAVAKIKAIAKRLYSEQRLNGDEMRDLAQALDLIASSAIEIPDPVNP